jgi:hypothetical protein
MSVARLVSMAANSDSSATDSSLGKVAAYIPSEVLGTYTAVLGVTASVEGKDWMPWAIYLGTLVLLVVYALLLYGNERRTAAAGTPNDTPLLRNQWAPILMAALAFSAYVMALPGSPFGGTDMNVLGGVLAIVLALLFPLVGSLIGVCPRS